MDKEFVTYEIGIALKQLSFYNECMAFYPNVYTRENHLIYDTSFIERTLGECSNLNTKMQDGGAFVAPLWQQVIEWFREQHQIFIELPKMRWIDTGYGIQIKQYNKKLTLCSAAKYSGAKTYEEAREQGVLKAIEVVKKRNKQL